MDDDKKSEFDYDYVEYKYGVDLRDGKTNVESGSENNPIVSEEKPESSVKMELYDWIQCIVAALLCGILIFIFVGRIIGVEGPSMMQTLQNGDKVIMSNLFFAPDHGDIVVIKTDYFEDSPIVKRVIATEGQTIDINFDTGEITLDGQILEEDYINGLTLTQEDFDGPLTIPEGYVFVMGDNRNESTDSRSHYVGLVDVRNILGKVYWVIIPGVGYDDHRDWSRFGSVY